MDTRDRPGWAEPPTDPSGRIVTCPECGQLVTWGEYVGGHGRDCPDTDNERGEDHAE